MGIWHSARTNEPPANAAAARSRDDDSSGSGGLLGSGVDECWGRGGTHGRLRTKHAMLGMIGLVHSLAWIGGMVGAELGGNRH